MPTINRTTHNDIPVISTDAGSQLTGTLAIGVGMKDEPAHLAGICHLAEHLILRSMGALTVMHNAVTGTHTVEFWATGTPEDVADYLDRVMRAITDLSFSESDLLKERLVIEAESPSNFTPDSGLLTYRYGIEGIGKIHAGAPTLASITADEVASWIREWFVVQNARLMFTGAPPVGLTGSLPAGKAPDRRLEERFIASPTLMASEKNGVALSMLVDENISFLLRAALVFELHTELRTADALIYSPEGFLTNTEPGVDQLDIILNPLEHNLVETLKKSVATVRRVARNGFSADAVRAAQTESVTGLSHPTAWWDYIDRLGTFELVGGAVETPDEWVRQARETDTAKLTSALNEALGSLVVAYDEDADLPEGSAAKLDLAEGDLGGNSNVPRRGPGKRWRGKGTQLRNWVRIDGTALHMHGPGWTSTTPISTIKIAGRFGDGSLHLFDSWGRNVLIDPSDWRRGEALADEIVGRLPAEIVRDFSWHDRDLSKQNA